MVIPDGQILADAALHPGMTALRERPGLLVVDDGDSQLATFELWNVPVDPLAGPAKVLAERERQAAAQALDLDGTLMLLIGIDPTSGAVVSPLDYTADRELLVVHFHGDRPAKAYRVPVNIAGEFTSRAEAVALEQLASAIPGYVPGVTYVKAIADLARGQG